MATVSILIPADKAQFLGRALISAQQQTFVDIEILVGDDTPGGNLEALVRRVGDSRVQYLHHGFQNGSENARELWRRASGKYVKWLSDDDVLMPNSVEILVAALREHPESALAFHGHVLIDGNDQVTLAPPALVNEGERVLLDRAFLVEHMIATQNNFVGEPSNIMLNRERVDLAEPPGYRSVDLLSLANVAMYLNLSARAPIVAVGGYGSAFRQHAGRHSSEGSPSFSAAEFQNGLSVPAHAKRMCGIVKHTQAVGVGNPLDFLDLTRIAVHVHGQDRCRVRGDGRLDLAWIEIHARRIDIGEDGLDAVPVKRMRGSNETEWRGDHLATHFHRLQGGNESEGPVGEER